MGKDFDMLSPNPSVEFRLTSKAAKGDSAPTVYAPKVNIVFFMHRDAIQKFLTFVMPLVFAACGNALNMWYAYLGDYDNGNFLSKALFTAVLVIHLTRSLGSENTTSHEFNVVKILTGLIFAGLTLGLRGDKHFELMIASNLCTWGAILLQFSGFLSYSAFKRKLSKQHTRA